MNNGSYSLNFIILIIIIRNIYIFNRLDTVVFRVDM